MDQVEPFLRTRTAAKAAACAILFTFPLVFTGLAQAVTKSFGEPHQGRLVGGVPFPSRFSGYQLRDSGNIYATPELVGALLDALETVKRRYPNTCRLYLGDFSSPSGGPLRNHASHQNGRDVDIGMYAKDNVELDGFQLMSADNLDVPKTWCLIESLLKTDRVQYMFLDKRLQSIFYEYALRHGWSRDSLDMIFKNVRQPYENAIIRHSRGHRDHIHVRFYAPWSALAAATPEHDQRKLSTISLAQAAYLPKKVKYNLRGTEADLTLLAQSFGVSTEDLCRWNNIRPGSRLRPGTCLVYYKRGFELEPVNLAQSLPAPARPSSDMVRLAAIEPSTSINDSELSLNDQSRPERQFVYHRVSKGESLKGIAGRYHLSLDQLCRLNGLSKQSRLSPGKSLKVGYRTATEPKPVGSPLTAFHTVGKGDTLAQIADRYHKTVEQLSSLNDLSRKSALKPGQQIKLNDSHKAGSESPKKTEHVVKSGDTLYSIAKQSDISVDDLCKANGIKSSNSALRQGQKLMIPAAAEPVAKAHNKDAGRSQPQRSEPVAAKAVGTSGPTLAKNAPSSAQSNPAKTQQGRSKEAAGTAPKGSGRDRSTAVTGQLKDPAQKTKKAASAKAQTGASHKPPAVKPKDRAAKSKATTAVTKPKA